MRLDRYGLVCLLLWLALGASLSGCASRRHDAALPLPEITRASGPQRPLIFLHGFMGSKLRNPRTGKVAWGTMANVLMGGRSDALALSLEPPDARFPDGSRAPGDALEPFAIYGSLWGRDFYREFLRSLRASGGYQIGDPDHPRPGDNAFVFLYDWRRDNVDSARRLSETIDRLRAARGRPDERFDIVAHSQGGLIARYYLKYGARDVLSDGPPFHPTMAGAPHINQVILVGTPNDGCLETLKVLHRGVRKVFRPMRPAAVFTMPGLYQMLPPPGSAVFADPEGLTLPLDLYDARTWARQQWSIFAPDSPGSPHPDERHMRFLERVLKRAALFHQALVAEPEENPAVEPVAYHVFGSDCISTLRRAVVTSTDGRPVLLFDAPESRGARRADTAAEPLYGPGDGTVLARSLLASQVPYLSARFVCGSHGVLTNNPVVENGLLDLLLSRREARIQGAAPGDGPGDPPGRGGAPAGLHLPGETHRQPDPIP